MKRTKHVVLRMLLLSLFLLLTLFSLNVSKAEDEVTLTILHMNDRHGTMDADPYLSQMAEDLKENGENVLILDAGDTLHGQIATNLTKGMAMVDLMNEVGYLAMVPGNHDFNFGVPRLKELSSFMDFPILGANVKDADGANLFQSYKTFSMNGVKVGVFGLSTPETVSKSDPRIVEGLIFEDPSETAKRMVEELQQEGCGVIIALTHLGMDEATDSVNESVVLADIPGIDVVIDGHSHTELDNGFLIKDTLIAQTGSFAKNIGMVKLSFTDGEISSKTASLVPVPENANETELIADERILAMIAGINESLKPITNQVVGYTPVLLQGEREYVRTGETNLANLISDSMRYVTNSDVAFLTGGNIRTSIPAGNITWGQVLTVLPFSNLLASIELKGSDLLEVLEHGVSSYPAAVGHQIQVSGLRFEFNPNAEPMHKVTKVTMANGETLDLEKTYTVTTIEFIMAGGDGYDMMKKGTNMIYYQGDVDAFVEYLATEPTMAAEPEYRVKAVIPSNDDPDKPTATPPTTPPPTATPPTATPPTATSTPKPDDQTIILSKPNITVKSKNFNSLLIKWNKVANADKYIVCRSTSKTGKYKKVKTVNKTFYTDSKLVTGKTYYYRVYAVCNKDNQTINGKYSNRASAKPTLTQVTGFKLEKSISTIRKLNWRKVSGAHGYEVYRATKKNGKYTKIKDAKRNRHTIRNLSKKKPRYYKVRAYRFVNNKKSYGRFSKVLKDT